MSAPAIIVLRGNPDAADVAALVAALVTALRLSTRPADPVPPRPVPAWRAGSWHAPRRTWSGRATR
ncbi:acyl-CoA carboxylase epsilon subunit [Saccharothrix australiensis]|uniref:Acyl-CoA carboxylase epsilon subunit-like protein n=1 Tax=Saccharothrix australiensis TaxID=2072 RepID=A0A495W1A5_9PSEU|nr:acyl-CoA carboxylase epsilon subunit [Saccharothrix australiensis]RKT55184.1 acyl-CoA carboxylase epsilon subunit-like protein [Saccharothrix australiensis]